MDWREQIKRIEDEVVRIRKYVNDMSHRVERMERDIDWIKTILKWGLTLLAFMIGLSMGL